MLKIYIRFHNNSILRPYTNPKKYNDHKTEFVIRTLKYGIPFRDKISNQNLSVTKYPKKKIIINTFHAMSTERPPENDICKETMCK